MPPIFVAYHDPATLRTVLSLVLASKLSVISLPCVRREVLPWGKKIAGIVLVILDVLYWKGAFPRGNFLGRLTCLVSQSPLELVVLVSVLGQLISCEETWPQYFLLVFFVQYVAISSAVLQPLSGNTSATGTAQNISRKQLSLADSYQIIRMWSIVFSLLLLYSRFL